LFILTCLSIFAGYFFKDLFLPDDLISSGFNVDYDYEDNVDREYIAIWIPLLPVGTGFFLASFGEGIFEVVQVYVKKFAHFINFKWFFDVIINNFVVLPILNCSWEIMFKLLDRGFLEVVGSLRISNIFYIVSRNYSLLQTGFIFHWIVLGVLFVLIVSFMYIASIFFSLWMCILGCLLIISWI